MYDIYHKSLRVINQNKFPFHFENIHFIIMGSLFIYMRSLSLSSRKLRNYCLLNTPWHTANLFTVFSMPWSQSTKSYFITILETSKLCFSFKTAN